MALARVQATTFSTTTSTASVSATFGTTPTLGNGITVCVFRHNATDAADTCSDTYGNAYTLAHSTASSGAGVVVQFFYCPTILTTGATFAVTAAGTTRFRTILAIEISGVGGGLVVDDSAGSETVAVGSTAGPTAALTAAEVFQVAAVILGASPRAITVGAVTPTWTQELELADPASNAGEIDSRIVTSATGTTPSVAWTWVGLAYAASAIVAFAGSAAAPEPCEGVVSLTVAGHEMIGDDPGVGLRRETLRVEHVLTARAVCSFSLINPTHVPVIEEDVALTIDCVAVFGGIVTRVEAEDWGDRETMTYAITCSDWMEVMDGFLMNDVAPAGTLKEILAWMLTRTAAFGFTLDPAQADGPSFPSQAYPFQTHTSALNNLTRAAGGWTWRISPTQVLGAYPWGAVPAPWEIDEDDLLAATMERSREQSANIVWCRFGGGEGTPASTMWTTVGNGTRIYDPPYTNILVGPNVVTVDDVPLPVFPAPNPGWAWDVATGQLWQDPTDPVLDATHTISITFEVAWPSYAVAVVTAAYERGVIVDAPNVIDPALAQTIADEELERRSGFPQTFKLATRRPGLLAGQATLLSLGQYGVTLLPVLLTSVRLLHAGRTSAGEPWWRFDIDAIAANKSRSNWIDFWRRAAGTGGTAGVGIVSGGGGGGTGPPGPPGTSAPAPIYLGGSRTVTFGGGDGWHPIIQFNDVILDPNASPTWIVRCQSWVLDDAYTVNVRVVEIEGSFPGYEATVIVGTGTATNATDWNTVEAFQEFTVTLVKGTPEYYRCEMQVSDADGEAWVASVIAYPGESA